VIRSENDMSPATSQHLKLTTDGVSTIEIIVTV
jgi:hypothetical protein